MNVLKEGPFFDQSLLNSFSISLSKIKVLPNPTIITNNQKWASSRVTPTPSTTRSANTNTAKKTSSHRAARVVYTKAVYPKPLKNRWRSR